jgi:hypothetical protein
MQVCEARQHLARVDAHEGFVEAPEAPQQRSDAAPGHILHEDGQKLLATAAQALRKGSGVLARSEGGGRGGREAAPAPACADWRVLSTAAATPGPWRRWAVDILVALAADVLYNVRVG